MRSSQTTENMVDERTLLVHAHFDDELDAARAASIQSEISKDPALKKDVEAIGALRGAVRKQFSPQPVSTQFRSRIDAAIGQPWYRLRPTWQALAASVVAAMILTGGAMSILRSNEADQKISLAVVDAHLRALITDQPITIASSDRHTVKPWFNGRIAQSPAVVDLSESGFPLVGGRVDVVDATPVATVVYKRRLHLISVFAIPGREAAKPLSAPLPIKGYNRVEWIDGQTEYWAISDLNVAELRTFSQLFREATAPAPKHP